MLLFRFYQHTHHIITRATVGLGRAVAWMTLVMVLLTTAIVLIRSLFYSNSVGAQELVTYLHAAVIMCACAYTLVEQGHVRVDVFYRRFSVSQRAWVDLVGSLIFLLPLALATIILSWNFVSVSWATQETSTDAGGLAAVFVLKTLLLVNGFLLALQAIAEALQQLIIIAEHSAHNSQEPR